MAGFGNEGERTGDALPTFQSHQTEQAKPQQGSPADAPQPPVFPEGHSWQERSHDAFVAGFRNAIQQEQQALGDLAKYHSPIKIIDAAFSQQVQYLFSDDQADKRRGEFFAPIKHAWEIIAYAHYGTGSVNTGNLDRHYAALALNAQYQRAKALNKPHPEVIRLADPLQIKILDAAAEAADIPHRKGLAAFEIPEPLRGYEERLWKANDMEQRRR